MSKILGTNEILGTFTSVISKEQLDSIIASASAEVSFIKNTDNEVHLALPYYSSLAKVSSLIPLEDSDVSDVAGGEVFVSLAIAGVIAAGAVAGGIAIGVDEAQKSK